MRQSAAMVPMRRIILLAALVVASIVFILSSAVWSGVAGAGRATGQGGHGTKVVSLDNARLTASVAYANGGNGNANGNGNGGNGNGGNGGNGGGTATPEPPSGVLFAIGLVPLALAGMVVTLVRRRSAAPAVNEE
jgi:hypothetical protein